MNVGELADCLELEVVTISHHLGVLRHAGLVERKKAGRFVVYSIREGSSFAGSSNKTAPDMTCFTSGAGKETAGRPSVLFTEIAQSTVRGATGELSSPRSRGIGTSRVPITGTGSSVKKLSS